jgi:hypothetical protein
MGYEVAFEATSPAGSRAAYVDTLADLHAMLEFTEVNESYQNRFGPIKAASVDWDGRDLIRRA